ncbi:hypothetical protein [Haloplanus aerogenes]|uniref:Uncharacterized protein n=1 Tax=Haloplanus aerogenes TaxID=660522 RepID=A0A3M0CK58_9EURY|nr:hypothetical protein [Haloplanus aerogenes]AZH26788.1 hypothetical protein DU502_16020 [Haloplanus aerogenes]RMB09125.1 hypothetical protein ATH50_3496 [Haloplanus aerogenes]
MSNGLGAGFAALTLLGVLGGIAVLATLSTVAAYAWVRRTGRLPGPFRYGFALLGVTGFGVLALYDEAPAAAGLFLLLGLLPQLVAAATLDRWLSVSRPDLVTTTMMAWSAPFLVGVPVTFGAMNALTSLLHVPAAGTSGTSVPWIASAVGGAVVALGTVLLGTRLVHVVRSVTTHRDW